MSNYLIALYVFFYISLFWFLKTRYDKFKQIFSDKKLKEIHMELKEGKVAKEYINPSILDEIKEMKNTTDKGLMLEKLVEKIFHNPPYCEAQNCTEMVNQGKLKKASEYTVDFGADVYLLDRTTMIDSYTTTIDENGIEHKTKNESKRPRTILIQTKAYNNEQFREASGSDVVAKTVSAKNVWGVDLACIMTTADSFKTDDITRAFSNNILLFTKRDMAYLIDLYNTGKPITIFNEYIQKQIIDFRKKYDEK